MKKYFIDSYEDKEDIMDGGKKYICDTVYNIETYEEMKVIHAYTYDEMAEKTLEWMDSEAILVRDVTYTPTEWMKEYIDNLNYEQGNERVTFTL